jgi:GxxExxY protein
MDNNMLYEEELTERIIGSHNRGSSIFRLRLLESAYQACLAHELNLRNIPFELEKPLPVVYKDVKLDMGIGWIF